jgi:translocator assembly and maintenance protein 41
MIESSDKEATGLLRSRQELRLLLEKSLPLNDVVYAFGYGSGVLSQTAEKKNGNSMVDVIVVVRDAHKFHEANLRRNPQHYSWLSRSPTVCTFVQRHQLPRNRWLSNPGVYFHVMDGSMKYGVVQADDLSRDLTNWSCLYLAGRLHKPVVMVLSNDDELEAQQQERNLPAALSAAMLLQWHEHGVDNNTYNTVDVYQRIASLSYTGDPRMSLRAEDPAKISNLVHSPGQLDRFQSLYRPAAVQLQRQGILSVDSNHHHQWTWDANNPLAHAQLWQSLPVAIRSQCRYDSKSGATAAAAAASLLPRVLAATVAPAARYQSIKGLWTAGLVRSAVYAFRKLSKGLLKYQ